MMPLIPLLLMIAAVILFLVHAFGRGADSLKSFGLACMAGSFLLGLV